MDRDHNGAIVIGSGPRGASLAHRLASNSRRILLQTFKTHELDHLDVTDASFFPLIGVVNPTLTIIANALRVADHLRERLGTTDIAPAEPSRTNSHVLGGGEPSPAMAATAA